MSSCWRSAVPPPRRQVKEEGGQGGQAGEKCSQKVTGKARTRDSLQALSKLGELVDGRYRIVSQPPIVVPARDLAATYGLSREETSAACIEQFRAYRASLER